MDNLDGQALVAVAVAGLWAGGLLRAYIRHRTRLELARELSTRTETRVRGLVRLVRVRGAAIIEETDADGHRIIHIGSPGDRPARKAA